MGEKQDGTRLHLLPVRNPVPPVPAYRIADMETFAGYEVKGWYYIIPDDLTTWTICNFTVIPNDALFVSSQVVVNDETYFQQYYVYGCSWNPGYKKSIMLRHPDQIDIYVQNVYPDPYTFYWQLDFFREKI